MLHVKEGVQFTVIAPGGFRILAALDFVARGQTVVITSACDGEHSGPEDQHHRGEAYDVRSQDLTGKKGVLDMIMRFLGNDKFFGFLEDEGKPNEHFHIQLRKGVTFG